MTEEKYTWILLAEDNVGILSQYTGAPELDVLKEDIQEWFMGDPTRQNKNVFYLIYLTNNSIWSTYASFNAYPSYGASIKGFPKYPGWVK